MTTKPITLLEAQEAKLNREIAAITSGIDTFNRLPGTNQQKRDRLGELVETILTLIGNNPQQTEMLVDRAKRLVEAGAFQTVLTAKQGELAEVQAALTALRAKK